MKKEELKAKIREMVNDADAREALADALFESINSDDESYESIGLYLMKSFLDDNVDGAMIAVSGWSFESLLVKAGLLPDTEGIFN